MINYIGSVCDFLRTAVYASYVVIVVGIIIVPCISEEVCKKCAKEKCDKICEPLKYPWRVIIVTVIITTVLFLFVPSSDVLKSLSF